MQHPLALALALIAVALGAYAAFRAANASVSGDLLAAALLRCFASPDLSRAIKLTSIDLSPPALPSCKRLVLLVAAGGPPTPAPGQSPHDAAREALRQAYIREASPRLDALWPLSLAAGLSLVATLCSLVLEPPLSNPDSVVLVTGAQLIALALSSYAIWGRFKITATTRDVFSALEEPLVKRWVDGPAPAPAQPPPSTDHTGSPVTIKTTDSADSFSPRLTFAVSIAKGPPHQATVSASIIKIGRSDRCQLFIDHTDLARMQAVIELAGGEPSIIDLGATKQTTVNGNKINKAKLAIGDVIGVGEVEIKLLSVDG